jgi:CheY-like chemotaxis protein
VEEFDLAIVDLELGTGEGMTGYELIAQIKERRPKMRVVVLTGCSLPESERAARRQGADAYWVDFRTTPSLFSPFIPREIERK